MPTASGQLTLKQRVLRAGGWNLAGYGVIQAIRLGSNLIITRLLVPEVFGVMAIVTLVLTVVTFFSDIGLRQNVVQSARGDDPLFLDTVWCVQILRGIAIWFVTNLVAFGLYFANAAGVIPTNSAYAASILPMAIVVASFAAVIAGFESTKSAAAHRRFQQRRLVQIDVISQVAAVAVMVAAAWLTRSIWAIVAGGIVQSLTTTTLSHAWLTGEKNRLRWERTAIRDLATFGKWLAAASTLNVLVANGDRLLLGALADTHWLGLYAIGTLIVNSIQGATGRLFLFVSLPALSEVAREDTSRLRDIYYKLRFPVDALLLVLLGVLSVAGRFVIDVLYDPRYTQAGDILEIVALSLFVVRYGIAHQMYLAVGQPYYVTVISATRFLAFYIIVPLLFYYGGLTGAVWGIAVFGFATVPLIYRFNARLGLNDFKKELLLLLWLPLGILLGATLNAVR